MLWGRRKRETGLQSQADLLESTNTRPGIQGAREELAEKGGWVEKLEEDLNAAHEQRAQNEARLKQVALELQVCAFVATPCVGMLRRLIRTMGAGYAGGACGEGGHAGGAAGARASAAGV